MICKLAFAKTLSGKLRVNANLNRSKQAVRLTFEDEADFASHLASARLPNADYDQLRKSASRAFVTTNTPVCCVEVKMSEQQWSNFGLSTNLASAASL